MTMYNKHLLVMNYFLYLFSTMFMFRNFPFDNEAIAYPVIEIRIHLVKYAYMLQISFDKIEVRVTTVSPLPSLFIICFKVVFKAFV